MITADLIESVPGERIVLKELWAALTAELKRRPSGPVAAFTGRRSVDSNGAWAHLEAVLRAADREVIRFSEIEAEPGIETVERMIALLKEIKPAAVIALGGGSVMDAAKAAYLAMQSGWKLADHFGVDCCSRVYPEAAPDRVICIPTTSRHRFGGDPLREHRRPPARGEETDFGEVHRSGAGALDSGVHAFDAARRDACHRL